MDAIAKEKLIALNNLGYNLVKFTNPVTKEEIFYIYDVFTPVDISGTNHTYKHKIKGMDVTEFLHMQSSLLHINMSSIQEGTLRSNINALKRVSREYSSHFLWENYLAG